MPKSNEKKYPAPISRRVFVLFVLPQLKFTLTALYFFCVQKSSAQGELV